MITKEKNLIKIIDTNGQEWIYDINLGQWIESETNNKNEFIIFSMYADNRTDNVCRYVALTICNFVRVENISDGKLLWFDFYPCWWYNDDNADFIRYVDKCVSANVPCLPIIIDCAPHLKTIIAHFDEYVELVANSEVVEYYRNCPDLPRFYTSNPLPEYGMDDTTHSTVSIWSYNRYILDIIRKYAPHYEKQFINLEFQDKNNIYYLGTKEVIVNNPRYLEIALYYFFKLLPYYRIILDDVAKPIEEYIKRCDFLKISPRKESNFIKLLIDIDKEYQVKKREFNKQLLVERYTPHIDNLAFEDDKYIIVIPLTEEAFAEEARIQNNCVYSTYFPDIVAEEDDGMRIVFMRKKEDINTPYVTIEIEFENQWHRIEQALQKNNEMVKSQEAQKFIEEYEKHLLAYYPVTHNGNNDKCEVAWEF